MQKICTNMSLPKFYDCNFFNMQKLQNICKKCAQKCKKTVVHKISIKHAEYALSIYAMVYFVNICCTPHFVHGYGRM